MSHAGRDLVRLFLELSKEQRARQMATTGPASLISRLSRGCNRVLLGLTALALLTAAAPVHAQGDGPVQVLTGLIEPDALHFYTIPDLKQGDILYANVREESGNLDPFLALSDVFYDRASLRERFFLEFDRAVAEGQDPVEATAEIADDLLIAWDDDSGEGRDAELAFPIPADGNYQLLVAGSPGQATFGDYRLTIGVNAPEVGTGEGQPTGATIAIFDRLASKARVSVQEITGTLSDDRPSTFFALHPMTQGDTIYVYVEATSGNLRPEIELRDYGDKPVRSGNFLCQQDSAVLQYTFDDTVTNFELTVSACSDGEEVTTGDFRLLIGDNAPEVLTGSATTTGGPILRQPIVVRIGFQMDQLSSVEHIAKNFTIVASIRMEYTDPALAYSPDDCQCTIKLFNDTDFIDFVSERDIIWPASTMFNQQGSRSTQNRLVAVSPDGSVVYFERFTAILGAPDFDFTNFPFDRQHFFAHIDLLAPEELFVYSLLEDFSSIAEHLGNEAWDVTGFDTEISSGPTGSRFSFRFDANRVHGYYFTRILIPLGLIIFVTWASFNVKDYDKRVRWTGSYLLIFTAFNFVIANDLPRLGYMTFMDGVLLSTFALGVTVVSFNILLTRLKTRGQEETAQRLNAYALWALPLIYATAFGTVSLLFL